MILTILFGRRSCNTASVWGNERLLCPVVKKCRFRVIQRIWNKAMTKGRMRTRQSGLFWGVCAGSNFTIFNVFSTLPAFFWVRSVCCFNWKKAELKTPQVSMNQDRSWCWCFCKLEDVQTLKDRACLVFTGVGDCVSHLLLLRSCWKNGSATWLKSPVSYLPFRFLSCRKF